MRAVIGHDNLFTSCEMEHYFFVFNEHILIKRILEVLIVFFKDHTVFGVKCWGPMVDSGT